MIKVEKNNLKLNNMENLTIIKFGAPWCGPCRMVEPILEGLEEKYSEIDFFDINVDENTELAKDFGIRSIPAIYFIKGNDVLFIHNGAEDSSFFESKINQFK